MNPKAFLAFETSRNAAEASEAFVRLARRRAAEPRARGVACVCSVDFGGTEQSVGRSLKSV